MTGAESLIDAFESGRLLPPRFDHPNLVDLARATAKLCGVSGMDLSPPADVMAKSVGDSDHIVLVMADGVGMNLVESMPRSSFLRRHLQEELLTVFPSTTSVALTSLATGQWPSTHAVTGWWTHLPELGSSATILEYTARSDGRDLRDRGVDPDSAFPVRSIWTSIPRDVLLIVPKRIAGSVYSEYFAGGRETVGYSSVSDGVTKTIDHVNSAEGSTFTYLYVPRVDGIAHIHGITRPEVRHALTKVDSEIERLVLAIGSRARVVVTADHGLLDAPAPNRHTLRPTPDLRTLLRFAPSGDARVIYLHTWDWARERIRTYFERRFGDRFLLVDTDDALALGLFGPGEPSDESRSRFGDIVAISAGHDILEYAVGPRAGGMVKLNSHHSGMTPDEMRIPMIVA